LECYKYMQLQPYTAVAASVPNNVHSGRSTTSIDPPNSDIQMGKK